jgi:hypothetical protein
VNDVQGLPKYRRVVVRWRHWTEFNKDKETIALKGLAGTVAMTAQN